MKLTFFGGATAILEHRGKRILFDPWLDDGIFHGSWYHYPPLKIRPQELSQISLDYVYISHIHEDHCSAGTIKYINTDAEIIIMDRQPNFVEKFLKNYKFGFKKIHLIPPRTPTQIDVGLIVDILEPEPTHQLSNVIDSALVIIWDDFIIFNSNDCSPYEEGLCYILNRYKKVDLALLPYAGGSGYPACYSNLSHDEKLEEKHRICTQYIQGFVKTVELLQPKYAMPFADQYIIAGSRSDLNKYLSHPPSGISVLEPLKQVGLADKLLLLNPSQSFDFESGQKIPDEPFEVYSERDRNNYIQNLRNCLYDHEKITIRRDVPLERLLKQARMRLWDAQKTQDFFPDFFYYIDVIDWSNLFMIDLKVPDVRSLNYEHPNLQKPYLKMTVTSTLLVLILINHISWNIADAALFIDYERQPNEYNPLVHAMLNFLKI
jgi:UDP-MurNAc hydroxylase